MGTRGATEGEQRVLEALQRGSSGYWKRYGGEQWVLEGLWRLLRQECIGAFRVHIGLGLEMDLCLICHVIA